MVVCATGSGEEDTISDKQLRRVLKALHRVPQSGMRMQAAQQRRLRLLRLQLSELKQHLRTEEQLLESA